jgi:hypothetical protein
MAQLPSSERNAQLVLNIFAHFKCRPGHVLLGNNFVAYAANNGHEMTDVGSGLQEAQKLGWIEEAQNGIRLTEAGFAEM